MPSPSLQFLAISGSLRAASSATNLLQAAAALAPQGVAIKFYDGLADLPHFNPDLDIDPAPPTVADFREQLRGSDAVLICTPEYAHGIPGSLKNALDWIVGSGEFMNKPVALLNPSMTSTHAHASLRETLTVMMAIITDETAIRVPLRSNRLSAEEMRTDPEVTQKLYDVLAALVELVRRQE